MLSHDNQPRQDDESSQVEHTNGTSMATCYCICIDTDNSL